MTEHVVKYVEEAGLIDEYVCSCGWKSGPYYDGAEFAYIAWKKHVKSSSVSRQPGEDTMKTAKTYDPACYDLAEYFLQDEPVKAGDPEHYKRLCDDLAKEIQKTVEDWFVMDVDPVALPQSPQVGEDVRHD